MPTTIRVPAFEFARRWRRSETLVYRATSLLLAMSTLCAAPLQKLREFRHDARAASGGQTGGVSVTLRSGRVCPLPVTSSLSRKRSCGFESHPGYTIAWILV